MIQRIGCAFALCCALVLSVNGSVRFEDDGETVRICREGDAVPFAEFRRSERSANCEIGVRTEKGSPFVFIDITPNAGKVSVAQLPRISLRGMNADSWAAVGSGGLTNLRQKVGSYAFCALGEVKTRRGYVAAWLTDEWASGSVHFDVKGVTAKAEYGPMRVKVEDAPRTDTFVIGAFDDCRLGLEAYADAAVAHHGVKLPRQISGFCTWYCDKGGYGNPKGEGGACSETETREFIDKVVELDLAKWGFDYFQIDDKWQDGEKERLGPRMVFGKVRPNGPYPNGMKPTVDYINSKGFVAGLWYMPFSGDTKDSWWKDKYDMFVKSTVTSPANDGVGKYHLAQTKDMPYVTPFGSGALDMSNPKTIEYVKETAARVTKEWGFRMIKFDGMYSGMAADLGYGREYNEEALERVRFADPGMSNAQAFRRGVRAMREGSAEGTRLLACNVKQNSRGIAASYGLVDLLRIGGDNGPIDSFPSRYMAGPTDGSPRYFLNGRLWYNDPDPVYVRDAVPIGRARLMATWTSLGGLLYNFSDWLPWLSAERLEILKRTLAPHRHPKDVRPVDYLATNINNVWKLTVGEYAVYGLYNWDTNSTLKIDYEAMYADLDPKKMYVGFDFWNNRFLGSFSGRLTAEVPVDDCRVIAVREFDGTRPVLVSTSRHVASPVFDVEKEQWSDMKLSGRSVTVPGEDYELRVYVPNGMRCVKAGSGTVSQIGNELRVRFVNCGASLNWELVFEESVSLDVEFVKGLLRIPSESRSIPECNRAVAYLKEYLESRGVYCHVERTQEGRDAIYVSNVPGKECDYAFVSHIDVVPAANPEQFVPRIEGDDIYARGACDTKMNAALMLQAVVELKGKASVGAFIATDEDGCAGVVPTCTMLRNAGFTPKKMIIVGDTSGGKTNLVSIAQKGHWGFKLTAKGRGGHSSIPWKLDNAIPKITEATEKLVSAYPKPPKDGGWCSTLAPTILQAGDAPNSIPGEASVTFSFRYVGKNDVEELRRLIITTTGLEPETLYCVPPVVNDPENPLILDFTEAMRRNWPNKPPTVCNADGATDAFQFSDLNLPIVIVSHDSVGGHKPVESGSIKSAGEYLNFFVKWLQIAR